jgi:DNA-binding PadR family transcriptional regulator/DNA-binding CsgD family transcriptional regulator
LPRHRHHLPITDPAGLAAALERLDPRERTLLEMRYGLAGNRAHNLSEIGKALGISAERVRQLEGRAVAKLTPEQPSASKRGKRKAHGRSGPATHRDVVRRWALILLWLRPAHVYELTQHLIELGVPPATYRQLYELEADGLVSSTWAPSPHAGPPRRVYAVTRQGIDCLTADRAVLEKAAHALTTFFVQHDKSGGGFPPAADSATP